MYRRYSRSGPVSPDVATRVQQCSAPDAVLDGVLLAFLMAFLPMASQPALPWYSMSLMRMMPSLSPSSAAVASAAANVAVAADAAT